MLGRRKEHSDRPYRESKDKRKFRSNDGPSSREFQLDERNPDRPMNSERRPEPDIRDNEEGFWSRSQNDEGNSERMERPNFGEHEERRPRREEYSSELIDGEASIEPFERPPEDFRPDYMGPGEEPFPSNPDQTASFSLDLESGPEKRNTGGLDIPLKFHPAQRNTVRYFISHITCFYTILFLLLIIGLTASGYSIYLKGFTDLPSNAIKDSDFWATVAQLASGTVAGLYLICVPWAQSGSINIRGGRSGTGVFVSLLVLSLLSGVASVVLYDLDFAQESLACSSFSGVAQIVATGQLIYATSKELQEQKEKIEAQKVQALLQAEELKKKEKEAEEREKEAVERAKEAEEKEKELARIKQELADAQKAVAPAATGGREYKLDGELFEASVGLIRMFKAEGLGLPDALVIVENLWRQDDDEGSA